jgi:hypothetical protein
MTSEGFEPAIPADLSLIVHDHRDRPAIVLHGTDSSNYVFSYQDRYGTQFYWPAKLGEKASAINLIFQTTPSEVIVAATADLEQDLI